MQINRRFEIIYILLNKKSVTAKELAEYFEVSVRTIYRDIDTLSMAGIPIYATQGKGGGISLLENYIFDKSVLSEREQDEILYALQSLSITKAPEADKILNKLSNLFNKNLTNWIEVDFSPWGSEERSRSQFTIIKEAILSRRVLEFNYINSFGEKSMRRVEPVKLIFKVNAWYLEAFCLTKHTLRNFKIVRMSDAIITQESFAEKNFEVRSKEEPLNRKEKWVKVRLYLSSKGAFRVYDEFDEKDIIKNEDGSFTIVTTLPVNDWAIRYILSFGADMEVLAPLKLRDKIKNEINKINKKYQR